MLQYQSINVTKSTPEKGKFIFTDYNENPEKPITVWSYFPANLTKLTPIIFVLHGVERNGREYRNIWANYAKQNNFILLVPEFSKQYYPKSRHYQQGNMFQRSGKPIDHSQWTFTTIERIFDAVKINQNLETENYIIYGHSAGAQFVHRLVMFNPKARFETAIAANSGWYTMPNFGIPFPYGLGNSGIEKNTLKQILTKKLIILLGTKDTNENDKHLRQTPQANEQGKHRLARGQFFYETAKKIAMKENINFQWQLIEVEGVNHSNLEMSKAAINLILTQNSN
ncbi:alpha/beta hydrolase [Crocosphaera chwakensis]|uniref:Alpha/beta hydrolase n=1 Tax=Crocosphaera chwakensis CCY0110 TaxID=391612 RepID=A3INP3_9CHRO|nr:alpha/beta hydrolase [Crocosphaera chwakensis]EAZ91941.1 hypothetical protein CY0110_29739 [Crocosphaera chwakensis CCY0110]